MSFTSRNYVILFVSTGDEHGLYYTALGGNFCISASNVTGLGLGLGLAGQVLALALAGAEKLRYINSNV